MIDDIKLFADSLGVCTTEYAPMSRYTSFKVGGPARLLIEPDSIDNLSKILKFCKEQNEKPVIIGNGTNVLFDDEGTDKTVIRINSKMSKVEFCGNDMIKASSGANLSAVCAKALEYGLSGFEFAYGIPGSVGGAVYMNAGAYGGEIKDIMLFSNHLDSNGEKGSFDSNEADFSYRHSAYCDNDCVITSAVFKGETENPEVIKAKMDDVLRRRKAKQPLEYPSAGSTFKRPEGNFAGALIEQCGLKGKSIGGAKVSEKHAGFIINEGNATAKDIKNLIDFIRETVYKETGVELVPEVKII